MRPRKGRNHSGLSRGRRTTAFSAPPVRSIAHACVTFTTVFPWRYQRTEDAVPFEGLKRAGLPSQAATTWTTPVDPPTSRERHGLAGHPATRTTLQRC